MIINEKTILEAIDLLEENGYLISEMNREEFDSNKDYDSQKEDLIRKKLRDNPRIGRLDRRGSKERNKLYNLIWKDKNVEVKVPGKRPGTTRIARGSERRNEINRRMYVKRDAYDKLHNKLVALLRPAIEDELEKLNMTYKEYCTKCSDWCIICYFSAPGSSNTPYIVQKGYKTQAEAEEDCAKFKAWAHTEITYTDVESMIYKVYPTEILENEGAEYKEKDVPQGEPPEFKAHPYYTSNWWGD